MIHHSIYFSQSLCDRLLYPLMVVMAILFGADAKAEGKEGGHGCLTGIAVKTNMLHDALLTPDVGIELNLKKRFSVSAEGVWAWWSRKSRNRFWRIYGGWIEGRYWLEGKRSESMRKGHHAGVYISLHTYDFEFGSKGWQSRDGVFGIGGAYGYSFPVTKRLNIDVGIRLGYVVGSQITYRPQCGEYICISNKLHRYFGPTDLSVSFVWYLWEGKSKKYAIN